MEGHWLVFVGEGALGKKVAMAATRSMMVYPSSTVQKLLWYK